jgi:hypothetical protein
LIRAAAVLKRQSTRRWYLFRVTSPRVGRAGLPSDVNPMVVNVDRSEYFISLNSSLQTKKTKA